MFFERHTSTGSASNPIGDPSKELQQPRYHLNDLRISQVRSDFATRPLLNWNLHPSTSISVSIPVTGDLKIIRLKPRVRNKDANAYLPAACSEARFWVTNVDASVASTNGAFERSSDEAPRWASPTGIQTCHHVRRNTIFGNRKRRYWPHWLPFFFISKPQLEIRFFNC